ncbi:YajQ family cyclic di-GMP-binding protein [Thioflexithrix psekupsensis]|uniref:Nucleotide-binding protein TPSD3_06010 n=1 Tax=Thioflexithrix psekupsensis TaxID=1570016 RepID=A0A251X840_9GAMM|nr:YajQ family cyclic di-GMP-binding protein [Thioflexithrix psekupsensis]OUD13897.1 YajQ family cyclic di-GMP-binding protein [Thioflexithrix psekupsensis]
MPSFDIVSELDQHELSNALDQANREIDSRFDFKGADARVERQESDLCLHAQSAFQLEQMLDILYKKVTKRGIDLRALSPETPVVQNLRASQAVKVKQGIDSDVAKILVKHIKESKLKVQATIQGDQVRVTGKKRDDLQEAIALLKAHDFGLPLQFTNFRD